MLDGRMPFEVPHGLDERQYFEIWVCDFVCFEVYVYTIINGCFVLSSACDQAGLWATSQKQVLKWSKEPAPVVKLD